MKLERELMRGAGPTAVLKLLSGGEKYGYELVESLAKQSDGVLAMGQSTLYPMLYNLEAKGLVKSRTDKSGPRPRRYYRLTKKGEGKLAVDCKQWGRAVRGARFARSLAETPSGEGGRMSAVLNNALRTAWRLMFFTPIREVLGMASLRMGWRQMIAAAELPKPVQEKIEQVTVKSKLWNRERADIAEELIAHFEDGLEAGASAEELATSFGDATTAAKLIRNAKRRCRPVWWQAWWWMSRSFLLFVPCYVLLAAWLSTARPVVSVDYQAIINKAAHAVPEEERAWPVYMEALRMVAAEQRAKREAASTPDHSNLYWNWLPKWADETSWTEEQFAAAKKWMAEHKTFLAKLREAAAMPRMGVAVGPGEQYLKDYGELEEKSYDSQSSDTVIDSSLGNILLPHLQDVGRCARVMKSDAYVAIEAEESKRVVSDIEAILGFARHAGEGYFLIAGLVKVAFDRMAFDLIEKGLRTKPALFSVEQLRQVAHQIASVEYDTLPYWEGEKMMFLDIVQRLYSDDGNGDGFLTVEGMRGVQEIMEEHRHEAIYGEKKPYPQWHFRQGLFRVASPLSYVALASRNELLKKREELSTEMYAYYHRPLWDRLPYKKTALARFEDMPQWQLLRYMPLELTLPAFGVTEWAFEHSRGRRDGVLIGIALELYRREHGDWPGSLAELAPRWLPEVPVDRINGGALGVCCERRETGGL